jgi:hypothetical protein
MANSSSSFLPGCCPGSQGLQVWPPVQPSFYLDVAQGLEVLQRWPTVHPSFYLDVAQGLVVLLRLPTVHPSFYLDVARGLKVLQVLPPVHEVFYLDVAQGLEVLLGLCVNVKSFPLRQAEFCHHPNQSPHLTGQSRIFKFTNITAKNILIQPFNQQQKPKKSKDDSRR